MNSSLPPPPVDPEIQLRTYFAVQLSYTQEPYAKVVEALCQTAKGMGILFRRVETLDVIQLGMRPFLRMRSDVPEAKLLLQRLHTETGRGIVYMTTGGFEVQFPPNVLGGRIAPVSSLAMHGATRGQPMMWRGPKIKNWVLQFQPAA